MTLGGWCQHIYIDSFCSKFNETISFWNFFRIILCCPWYSLGIRTISLASRFSKNICLKENPTIKFCSLIYLIHWTSIALSKHQKLCQSNIENTYLSISEENFLLINFVCCVDTAHCILSFFSFANTPNTTFPQMIGAVFFTASNVCSSFICLQNTKTL